MCTIIAQQNKLKTFNLEQILDGAATVYDLGHAQTSERL